LLALAAALFASACSREEPSAPLSRKAAYRSAEPSADLALSFLAFAREHPNEVTAQDYVALGERLAAAKELDGAIELLGAGLRERDERALEPLFEKIRAASEGFAGAPEVRWRLGRLRLEQFERSRDANRLNQALADFEASLASGGPDSQDGAVATPDDRLQANLGLGWCYLWRGILEPPHDFETPRAIFDQILIGFPDNALALCGKGVVESQSGEIQAARATLERALAIDPNLAPAWFNLGQIHMRERAPDRAADAFERALALQPGDVHTLVWTAIAMAETDRTQMARELLGTALELAPENVEAMVQLGIVHAIEGSFDRALDWLQRALRIDPGHGNAYLQKAKVEIALGDPHRAAASLHQACLLLPDSFEAHYNLGVLLASSEGAEERAIELLERAAELTSDPAQAQAILGTVAELRSRE
jgi:tetratricopeptide (TPR) repeat protein